MRQDFVSPTAHPHPDGRPAAYVTGGPAAAPSCAPADLGEALAVVPADAGTTYVRGDESVSWQSYRDLHREAGHLAHGLRLTGLVPGDSVLLQCDDNRNLVTAVWACVLGGFVATPVATAPVYDDNAITRRLHYAWELLDRPLVLTDTNLVDRVHRLPGVWAVDRLRIATVEELSQSDVGPVPPRYPARPEDPVIQLLTSGSTGMPKCVRHAHRSLVALAYGSAAANGFGQREITLNWMPLEHVGGIVMSNIRDVLLGCEHVNARTEGFMADPLRWLDWIDRFRATNTWAPNFAFALVNERAEEIGRRRWDLSSMRVIGNGGEAMVSRTAQRFLRLLRPHNLPPDAIRPTWGMSETASAVTFSGLSGEDERRGTHAVDPTSLAGEIRLVEQARTSQGTGATTLVEVGAPIPGISLRIVDQTGAVVPEDRVGRLQVTGATMMTGYHNNAAANREAFTADGWFDTGDLAFLHGGRLTITGRAKDVTIIRGADHLRHEIESVVSEVDGVLPTYAAMRGTTATRCGRAGNGRPVVAVLCADRRPLGMEIVESSADVRYTTAERLPEDLRGADALFVWDFQSTAVEAAWPAADALQWVHVASAGVDAVLFPALRNSDVVLTNSRGVFEGPIAEYVLGIVLTFAKDFAGTFAAQRERRWHHRETERIDGGAVVIVGTGPIGRAAARILRSVGMRVEGIGRTRRDHDPDFGMVHGFDQLTRRLPHADFVVSATPLTERTIGMFNASTLAAMKPSARLINVGRGALVVTEDLVAALRNGVIAGAALDVFDTEPLPASSPLWSMPTVLVSPHMSGDFAGSLPVLAELFVDNYRRWLSGNPLRNVVDKRLGYVPIRAPGG